MLFIKFSYVHIHEDVAEQENWHMSQSVDILSFVSSPVINNEHDVILHQETLPIEVLQVTYWTIFDLIDVICIRSYKLHLTYRALT